MYKLNTLMQYSVVPQQLHTTNTIISDMSSTINYLMQQTPSDKHQHQNIQTSTCLQNYPQSCLFSKLRKVIFISWFQDNSPFCQFCPNGVNLFNECNQQKEMRQGWEGMERTLSWAGAETVGTRQNKNTSPPFYILYWQE